MDMAKMEEVGVLDYYLDLDKYIHNFVNKNYPLTEEDMRACMPNTKTVENNGQFEVVDTEPLQLTENLKIRNEITNLMKQQLQEILKEKAEENLKFLKDLESGKPVKAENIEKYKQNIFNYQQRLLEVVWQYKNSGDSLKTQVVAENEEYIREAITEGISADAVESTLGDVISKSDETGKTPTQVKEVVETIVDMKENENTKIDEQYASDFVKKNSEKIESALSDGISTKEIATTLVNSTNEATNKKGKKHLNFIVNLISKMKKKELKLNKDKENTQTKGYQRVLK